jgi:hypothetical protein
MESPVRREIAMDGHQASFQGNSPNQLQEEALSRPEITDDQAESGPAVADPVDVLQ